jgi:Prp19/Pso4-like
MLWTIKGLISLGTVYEKRLIESYISENGTDPVTGEDLTVEDLIDLRTSRIIRPRPPTLTSIPSLLGVFQEEWDALALETYTVKQNLAQTRQELSTALYQHDAAVRVIARLTRERDEAREALSKVSIGSRAGPTNGDAMQVDNTGLPDALISKVDETKSKYAKRELVHRYLLIDTGLRKRGGSDQSQKTGRLMMRFRLSSLSASPNLCIREGESFRLTSPTILL